VSRPVTLHVRHGIPVTVALERVERAGDDVELTATADPAAWGTIEGGLLFNLDSALDDDGQLPPMLGTDAPVTFTARLGDEALAQVGDASGDELAERVATDGDALNDTEAWFLARAEAEGGDGYTTRFSEAGPRVRPGPARVEVRHGDDQPQPGRLLALALSFLRDAEIDVDVLSDTVAGGVVEGENGTFDLVVHSREEAEQLLAYARMKEVVPEDRRHEVMELVTRINVQLTGSWLELDLDEGRVSARCTLNARGTDVTDDTFAENVIWMAVSTLDEYLPALRAVAFEGLDVADIHAAQDEG